MGTDMRDQIDTHGHGTQRGGTTNHGHETRKRAHHCPSTFDEHRLNSSIPTITTCTSEEPMYLSGTSTRSIGRIAPLSHCRQHASEAPPVDPLAPLRLAPRMSVPNAVSGNPWFVVWLVASFYLHQHQHALSPSSAQLAGQPPTTYRHGQLLRKE